VNGVGATGQNTEVFVAGTVLFNFKKLVFEGLVTGKLTNSIWTSDNPIALVEGWSGSLDPVTNTVTFETSAPDNSFIIPAQNLQQASAAIVNGSPLSRPEATDFTGAEKAKLEWFEKVHQAGSER
jgi:hypothetical protein